MAQLQRLDERQVAAVNVRSELDLRTGACFTRFQTLNLRQAFPALSKEIISYGKATAATRSSSSVNFLGRILSISHLRLRSRAIL
jgi:hypothetical protein